MTSGSAAVAIAVVLLGAGVLGCKDKKEAAPSDPASATVTASAAVPTATEVPDTAPVPMQTAAPTTAAKNPCKDDEVMAGAKCRRACRADMDCDGTNYDCLPVKGKGYKACQPAPDSDESIGEMDVPPGGCPSGWSKAEDQCHRACTADGDCQPPTSYCKKWQGKRLCARTGSLVVPQD